MEYPIEFLITEDQAQIIAEHVNINFESCTCNDILEALDVIIDDLVE